MVVCGEVGTRLAVERLKVPISSSAIFASRDPVPGGKLIMQTTSSNCDVPSTIQNSIPFSRSMSKTQSSSEHHARRGSDGLNNAISIGCSLSNRLFQLQGRLAGALIRFHWRRSPVPSLPFEFWPFGIIMEIIWAALLLFRNGPQFCLILLVCRRVR